MGYNIIVTASSTYTVIIRVLLVLLMHGAAVHARQLQVILYGLLHASSNSTLDACTVSMRLQTGIKIFDQQKLLS